MREPIDGKDLNTNIHVLQKRKELVFQ